MKKMIHFFTFFILQFFICDLCVAQNTHSLDSLLKVIATVKADTSRFYAYADVVREYAQIRDFEKAKAYSDTALQIGVKLSTSRDKSIDRTIRIGMAKTYLGIAAIHYYQYQFPLADVADYKALSYIKEENSNSKDVKQITAKI